MITAIIIAWLAAIAYLLRGLARAARSDELHRDLERLRESRQLRQAAIARRRP